MIRLVVLLLLAAAPCRADEAGPSFGSLFRYTETGGPAIYAGACAACHMPDGQGAVGAGRYPALAGDERLVTAGFPIARVLAGHGAMPGFARSLSDEQIAAVVDYIRTSWGNTFPDAPTAADVAAAR